MNQNTNAKKIGLFSAIGLGISAIMGSGWLFAPYKASVIAGPADILAWIMGGLVLCLLGLCFSEIATIYPKRGLSAIIPVLSHNKYFAFPFAIANWLGIVAVIPLEADATIQYLMTIIPSIEPYLFQHNQLTLNGDMFSIVLVILFSLVNYWGVSTLVKTNNVFAVIKVLIPITIGIAIISAGFHWENFSTPHHPAKGATAFIPYGYQSIFAALLSSGIVVAFNGFQTVISFASEVQNPKRNIPLAVIIAILFCMGIYILLQVAFIGAVPANMLKAGWNQLQFTAPIVQILGLMGLTMLSSVIYFGATVSPSGTAIAYTGSASRMFTAMAKNEQMPRYFDYVNPTYNVPRRSLIMNTVLAIIFLLLFRSWGSVAEVVSIFHVISYLPVPIAMWVFRERISKDKIPFRVPFGRAVSLFLFTFFTYLFTLADLKIATEVMIFFVFFMGVFILINTKSIQNVLTILNQIWPMAFYFMCLLLLIAASPAHSNLFTEKEFLIVVFVSSILLFICLTTAKKDDPKTKTKTTTPPIEDLPTQTALYSHIQE